VVSFGFAALSYRAPEKNQYAYRLDPFDDSWAMVGSKRTATYTNLDPGRYTFRVKGSNEVGVWNQQGTSVEVVVLPPFWATWWFRGLAAVTLAVGVAAAYRLRTRTIRRRNAALLVEVEARRKAEEELERLVARLERQNAELERFNYSVSHDLKTPLVTIKGFLGALRSDLAAGDAPNADADMARIERAADHMQLLLKQLLELGRLDRLANQPEAVPLTELARAAAELSAGALAAREVQLEIQPDMPGALADRGRLLQAYQNLLDNALKFLGDQPQPRIHLGASREGAEVRCFVKDNGIGIERPYHERVFRIFERLSGETDGAGVGLAIVQRVVESHGGRVWVESEGIGKGSTFWFTLPADRGSEPPSA
jgi:signal transduction histidine kinase